MKRIISITVICGVGLLLLGFSHARKQEAAETLSAIERQSAEAEAAVAAAKMEQAAMRTQSPARAAMATPPHSSTPNFSPALSDYLAAGNFTELPRELVGELRNALGLSDDFLSDYVFISKSSMQTLRPPSPGHNDKLSDTLCALLSIGPEERSKIENSLAASRQQFSNWAQENVKRDGPDGETVVRYTLPAATDFAEAVTNNLMTAVGDMLGAQRASLFRTYAETWFQIEMGYLGGVTNTLSVLRRPKENGDLALFYELKREGDHSSMSEGPSVIERNRFPPAWRNVFAGGWAEVAGREGLTFGSPGLPANQ